MAPALGSFKVTPFNAERPKDRETMLVSRKYGQGYLDFADEVRRIFGFSNHIKKPLHVTSYYFWKDSARQGHSMDVLVADLERIEEALPIGANLFLCAVFDGKKNKAQVESLLLAAQKEDLERIEQMKRVRPPAISKVDRATSPLSQPVVKKEKEKEKEVEEEVAVRSERTEG
jgi:hypothetical protein